jgi:hypothetical protein
MRVKRLFALVSTFVLLISMTGVLPVAAASLPYSSTGVTQTFVVLYKKNTVPSNAAALVSKAGGTLVNSYKQIGVLIASSDNAAFSANLLKDSRVQGAVATTKFATHLDAGVTENNAPTIDPGTPAPGNDSLSGLQWDMVQIHAPEARAINGHPS